MSDLLEKPDTQTTDGDGEERDRQKHYVPHAELEAAIFSGRPARALCGKLWVPSRDPDKYPLCKTCKKIFEALPPGPK